MISALSWIPKGAAAQHPKRLNLTDDDFHKIQQEIGVQVEEARLGLENAQLAAAAAAQPKISNDEDVDDMAKYNLDTYDDEEGGQAGIPVFGKTAGLTYHASNTEDPYVLRGDEEDDEEELGEMEVREGDNLIIACKTEDEMSHLEIFLYEEPEDNLYIHHDILLPSFPLCAEWLDYSPSTETKKTSNLVAVGTFEPTIEIWDLDTIDAIYPILTLGAGGANPDAATTRKKKQKAKKANDERHVGPVTALSWNKSHRNLILSASVDGTVKLWDLSGDCSKAVKSYNHHTDKVTAVCWNPSESTVFLTGGYDQGGRVCALDSRSPGNVSSWVIGSDVECIKWDPHNTHRFLVSSEDGIVRCFDARNPDAAAIYTIHAHDSAVSALDMSPHIEGLLVTGGADKSVKIWDVREGKGTCIVSRDLGVGKVFSAGFCMDGRWVLAASGGRGKVVVWNLEGNTGVRRAFGEADEEIKEGRVEIVGVLEEEEVDEYEDLEDLTEGAEGEEVEEMNETFSSCYFYSDSDSVTGK